MEDSSKRNHRHRKWPIHTHTHRKEHEITVNHENDNSLFLLLQHGTPTSDWKNDIEGKPEHIASKIAKKVAKIGAQVTKKVAAEYIQDENIASIVEGVADGVENQADADRNATIGDRLKRGGISNHKSQFCMFYPLYTAGDAVGVAGSGIQLASEYVPDEIGQSKLTFISNQ